MDDEVMELNIRMCALSAASRILGPNAIRYERVNSYTSEHRAKVDDSLKNMTGEIEVYLRTGAWS